MYGIKQPHYKNNRQQLGKIMKKGIFSSKYIVTGLSALVLAATANSSLAGKEDKKEAKKDAISQVVNAAPAAIINAIKNKFVVYDTNLSGANSLPPFHTSASGSFTAKFSDDMQVIHYGMYYQDLHGDAQAAHLHFAQSHSNGGALFTICNTATGNPQACPTREGWVRGSVYVSDIPGIEAQGLLPRDIDAVKLFIKFGLTYVNVHTTVSGSELRGQLKLNDRPLALKAAAIAIGK